MAVRGAGDPYRSGRRPEPPHAPGRRGWHDSPVVSRRHRRRGASVKTDTIDLPTPDGAMQCYEAKPDEARGAVVVGQEAFGVNDNIEDVARRFAVAGYHAVAPHIFHRTGGGTAPYDDFSKVMPMFGPLDDNALLTDIDAALAHLTSSGWSPEQIGIVGFCMGGRVTFLVAARRAIGAAVGFYGGGIVSARFPQFPPLVDEA